MSNHVVFLHKSIDYNLCIVYNALVSSRERKTNSNQGRFEKILNSNNQTNQSITTKQKLSLLRKERIKDHEKAKKNNRIDFDPHDNVVGSSGRLNKRFRCGR